MKWTESQDGKTWTREDGAFVVRTNTASGAKPWQKSFWGLGKWRRNGGIYYGSAQSAMKAVDRENQK